MLAGVRRGCWRRGRSRQSDPVAVAGMLTALHDRGVSWGEMLRAAGVSDRTIRKWARGSRLASLAKVLLVVDAVSPQQRGALPLVGDMAIDGGTRVLGVGQYSICAARGEPMVVQDE